MQFDFADRFSGTNQGVKKGRRGPVTEKEEARRKEVRNATKK
jgi:hypothetical protein